MELLARDFEPSNEVQENVQYAILPGSNAPVSQQIEIPIYEQYISDLRSVFTEINDGLKVNPDFMKEGVPYPFYLSDNWFLAVKTKNGVDIYRI